VEKDFVRVWFNAGGQNSSILPFGQPLKF